MSRWATHRSPWAWPECLPAWQPWAIAAPVARARDTDAAGATAATPAAANDGTWDGDSPADPAPAAPQCYSNHCPLPTICCTCSDCALSAAAAPAATVAAAAAGGVADAVGAVAAAVDWAEIHTWQPEWDDDRLEWVQQRRHFHWISCS